MLHDPFVITNLRVFEITSNFRMTCYPDKILTIKSLQKKHAMRTSRKRRIRKTGFKKITVILPRARKRKKNWSNCELEDADLVLLEQGRRLNVVLRMKQVLMHGGV